MQHYLYRICSLLLLVVAISIRCDVRTAHAQLMKIDEVTASDGIDSDQFGNALAVSGTTLVVGSWGRNFDTGLVYIYTRNNGQWKSQTEIAASDGKIGDSFGYAVAFDGTHLVVGAPYNLQGRGAVYVFVQSNGKWTQQAKLTATDGKRYDAFGTTMALSGNSLLVGAPNHKNYAGAVYVFALNGSLWTQQAELTASDAQPGDQFGSALALSGTTLVIGAPIRNEQTGAAYVYTPNGTTWTQQSILTAKESQQGDEFGGSISVNGPTIAVGAPYANNFIGAAYTFGLNNGQWSEQVVLSAIYGQTGDLFGASLTLTGNILVVGAPGRIDNGTLLYFYISGILASQLTEQIPEGVLSGDAFGTMIAQNGNLLVVGAPGRAQGAGSVTTYATIGSILSSANYNDTGFGSSVGVSGTTMVAGELGTTSNARGDISVFTLNNGQWTLQTQLTASDGTTGDGFGISVAIAGNTAVVGAPYHNGNTGAAYIFAQSNGKWTQQAELSASDGQFGDVFGYSIAISGSTVVIGAVSHNRGTGVAYVFTQSNGKWTQQAELSASDGKTGDGFGYTVAISGSTVVIGQPVLNAKIGAAYVFSLNNGKWTQQAKLTANDEQLGDLFGRSVAISGNAIVIGASLHNSQTGAAYVFTLNNGKWAQQDKLTAFDSQPGDLFGYSVAVSGNLLAVAAPFHHSNAGIIHIFTLGGGHWIPQGELTTNDDPPPVYVPRDYFGASLALSGLVIAIGESGGDSLAYAATLNTGP